MILPNEPESSAESKGLNVQDGSIAALVEPKSNLKNPRIDRIPGAPIPDRRSRIAGSGSPLWYDVALDHGPVE